MPALRAARYLAVAALLAAAATPETTPAGEWSGPLGVETRVFPNDPADPQQHDNNISIFTEPEFYHDWDDGAQRFAFTPFARWDAGDDERTHADIRELYWRKSFEAAEFSVGVRKFFWGVTESVHLVDIINQTDFVEDFDTEDKLGQPMTHLALIQDWGTAEFFVMPYFRERTFPGRKGRPRFSLVVDTDNPVYESSAEQERVDLAVRWSHYIGDWDLGFAHFYGTSRQPRLVPELNAAGEPVLIPNYDIIDQTSADVQATKGDWLIKLEALTRDAFEGRYFAAVSGFEYTFVGLSESVIDLGLVVEYQFDDRGEDATTPFQNDVVAGARFAFNDAQSTDLLVLLSVDLDHGSRFFSIEGSRRIGQSWTLELEVRVFSNVDADDPILFGFRDDDYLELTLSKFF